MMAKHDLKTWPEYWQSVWDGTKTFEVRKNDRNYQVGDTLVLREWDPLKGNYTGSGVVKKVTYILDDAEFVKDGYVIMGIGRIRLSRGITSPLPNKQLEEHTCT